MCKLTYLHINMITLYSSLSLTSGVNSQTDFSVGDGQEFIKRIANGEKIPEPPGILMFTAPYKLCDGGCKGSDTNIAVGFPLYIGKRGREAYKKIYLKDFKKKHHGNPRAPFKRKTTRAPFTRPSCSIINIISTVPTTTAPPTSMCPYIIPGTCLKYKKPKKNKTNTYHNSNDTLARIIMLTLAVDNNSLTKEALQHTTSGFEKSGRESYYTNDKNKLSYDSKTENVGYEIIVPPKVEKLKLYNYENNIQSPDVQTSTKNILNKDFPVKQVISSDVQVSNAHIKDVHIPDIAVPNTQIHGQQQISNKQDYQPLSQTQVPSIQFPEVKDSIAEFLNVLDPIIEDLNKQNSNLLIEDVNTQHKPVAPEPDTYVLDSKMPPKQIPNKQILLDTKIPPEQISDRQILSDQVTGVQLADTQISLKQVPVTKILPEQVPGVQSADTQIALQQVPDVQIADMQDPNLQFSPMLKLNEPVQSMKLSITQGRHEQPSTEPVPNTQVPKLEIPTTKVSELRDMQNINHELLDKFIQYLRHRLS